MHNNLHGTQLSKVISFAHVHVVEVKCFKRNLHSAYWITADQHGKRQAIGEAACQLCNMVYEGFRTPRGDL